ncbi:hypothetical protein [Demetria terragena]|uniref:hypothetical protein n=1 Tax=Demetria terragena TaxID=63959 RepID=UPI000362AB81|nr:hypothetical protein [Demetria terragena]
MTPSVTCGDRSGHLASVGTPSVTYGCIAAAEELHASRSPTTYWVRRGRSDGLDKLDRREDKLDRREDNLDRREDKLDRR